jgi:hypothetical protein
MVKTGQRADQRRRNLTSNVHQHKQSRDRDHVFAKFLPKSEQWEPPRAVTGGADWRRNLALN